MPFVETLSDEKDFVVARTGLLLAISDIVQKHNAEIAFPTRTIHINKTIPDISQGSDI